VCCQRSRSTPLLCCVESLNHPQCWFKDRYVTHRGSYIQWIRYNLLSLLDCAPVCWWHPDLRCHWQFTEPCCWLFCDHYQLDAVQLMPVELLWDGNTVTCQSVKKVSYPPRLRLSSDSVTVGFNLISLLSFVHDLSQYLYWWQLNDADACTKHMAVERGAADACSGLGVLKAWLQVCNCDSCWPSKTAMDRLQPVRNAAAWLIFSAWCRDHVQALVHCTATLAFSSTDHNAFCSVW